ncbi:hypothetical protein [Anoxybacter fermentans]|nr:hypothetical protein [Anoxybacter fermentans]
MAKRFLKLPIIERLILILMIEELGDLLFALMIKLQKANFERH